MRVWQAQNEITSPRAEVMNAIIEGTSEPSPFVRNLKLPWPEGWEPGRVWLRWKVDPSYFNDREVAFGGYLAALADQALGLATLSVLDENENVLGEQRNIQSWSYRSRQPLFEVVVNPEGSADEPRRGRARAMLVHGLARGL